MGVPDFLALGVFIGLPALEFYAWFTASWWHSDRHPPLGTCIAEEGGGSLPPFDDTEVTIMVRALQQHALHFRPVEPAFPQKPRRLTLI
jgi:hypothetical protein